MTASKEYGYRGGELLVTMSSGDDQRLKRFVTNLYYGALRRDPTPQELQDASNQLAAAGAQSQSQLLGTAKQVARALFTQTSYEMLSPARTDPQYVADLYYAYMQRAADNNGLNWWVSQLGSKTRSGVCDDFQNSIEFDVLVTTLYGAASSDDERTDHFINNLYLGADGAFAPPAQLQQRRGQLNVAAAQNQDAVKSQAETIAREVFAAQVTDLSISAQQFVTNLYEGFLQRGPDATGLSFWTTQAGTTAASRQGVLDQFATCGPFRELSGALYRETFWLVPDHLGTPRMIVDKSGSLAGIKRHDYLPFGGELMAGQGNRTLVQDYNASDNVRQKFTDKERDTETELDYFGARYYANVQGRFTSVDPDNAQGFLTPEDPQSWNGYSYVKNNPCKNTDPNGMCICLFQRFSNWRNDYGFQSDESVEGQTNQYRADLLNRSAELGRNNGTYSYRDGCADCEIITIDVRTASREDIWAAHRALGQIGKPLTPEEVSKILQNIPAQGGLRLSRRPRRQISLKTRRIPSTTSRVTMGVPAWL